MDVPAELSEEARRLLNAPIKDKVDWVLADAWVHTANTSSAFQWMGYMYRCGRVIRPPCLQIVADGGMGKTALLQTFTAMYPVQETMDNPLRLRRPVVYAECKAENSGQAGVRHTILKACWPMAKQFDLSEEETDETLRAQDVRIILLDEFGELTKAGVASHRRGLSELKRISNIGRVGIVAATVSNLAHVLDVDQQFATRFKRKIVIPPWSLSPDLRNFVFGLERNLPFPIRSFLDGKTCLPWIAKQSEGNTKEIVDLIRLGALHALGVDASRMRLEHLKMAAESPLPPEIALQTAA